MNPTDFQSGPPGRLVPVKFRETRLGIEKSHSGHAFVPDPLPPKLDWNAIIARQFDLLDKTKSALVRLEGMVDRLPRPSVLLGAMRVREAQASSKIENTFSSVRDIAIADIGPPQASPLAVEAFRNRKAIEAGLDSNLPVCARLLRDMHSVLIVDPAKRPGQLRDVQVCIGDDVSGFASARFVPPPPDVLPRCLKEWELFVNPRAINAPSRQRLPFFIELALAHYQFEAIHPFSDGNGRLGRALVNLAPVKDGELRHPVCNLSEWVYAHRQEYYDRLLRVSTHSQWEEWLCFFCSALLAQAEQDFARAERLIRLHAEYMIKIVRPRASSLLGKLIDHLFVHQAITIRRAEQVMKISYTAAQRHVNTLVDLGILHPADDRNYGRIFIAEGIIDAIRGDGEE